MRDPQEALILLCHRADWEYRYQASAAAAAAATAGREVRMVFFFGALDALLNDRWDAPPAADRGYAGGALAERVDELGVATPSELLAAARRSGRCKLLACSASLALVSERSRAAPEMVDEVVGWPTVVQLMQPSSQVIYL